MSIEISDIYICYAQTSILGLSMLELINDDSSVHVELEEEKILKEEKTDAAHPWVCPS